MTVDRRPGGARGTGKGGEGKSLHVLKVGRDRGGGGPRRRKERGAHRKKVI